jgi:hypothetical protein
MWTAVEVMRLYPLAKLACPCYERIGGSKLICSISGSDGNLIADERLADNSLD